MNCPCVSDEIQTRPWVTSEEFRWQHVALEAIAAGAREDDVAWRVSAAVRERVHMIERREIELEMRCAVDASPAAIAHGRVLDGALLIVGPEGSRTTVGAGCAWEGPAVEVPTS